MGRELDEIRNAVLKLHTGVGPPDPPTDELPEGVRKVRPEYDAETLKRKKETDALRTVEVSKLKAELERRKTESKSNKTPPNFSMTKPEPKNLGGDILQQVMERREKQIASRFQVPSEKRKTCIENVNTKLLKDILGKLMP